jgi:ribosomal protein S18 acetylase RimI-like enzyme
MHGSTEPVVTVCLGVRRREVLRANFAEVASRYYGRPATDEEVAAAMREEPSDDLTPPGGLLLVAVQDGTVLGCAGLRLLPGGIGEVTRVFVMPAARRRRLGSRLLDELEGTPAITTSHAPPDTRRDLVEARAVRAPRLHRSAPVQPRPLLRSLVRERRPVRYLKEAGRRSSDQRPACPRGVSGLG